MARVPQDTGEERLIPAAEVMSGLTAAGAQVLERPAAGHRPRLHPARRRCGPRQRSSGCSSAPRYVQAFAAHNVIVARKREHG